MTGFQVVKDKGVMVGEAFYRVADAHAHIFPGKIAEKATRSIGDFYGIPMAEVGLPHRLIEQGEKIGVTKYLVCSTATTPGQVETINNFIHEKCGKYPQFVGLATLHPDYPKMEEEIDRIGRLGLRGIKLHPDFQKFCIDDERMIPVYRMLAEKKLPVLFHTGDDRYDFSHPKRLYNVLQKVPELIAIAAHFGGYRQWDESAEWLADTNVYMDTSSTLFALEKEKALKMLARCGTDRFFFGTDYPMWDHEKELGRFLSLGLSEAENRAILYDNFARLFLGEGN